MITITELIPRLEPMQLVGFAGQGLYFLRVLVQWWASERRGRVVIPASYWWLSIAGALLLLAYAWSTRDPIFVVGPLVSAIVFTRNLWLTFRPPTSGASAKALAPAAAALATLLAIGIGLELSSQRLLVEAPLLWIITGVAGQTLWSGRHLVQWWISERRGESALPPAFFQLSIVGSALLAAYAVHRGDLVFIVAHAIHPIAYARGLVLSGRKPDAAPQPTDATMPSNDPRRGGAR